MHHMNHMTFQRGKEPCLTVKTLNMKKPYEYCFIFTAEKEHCYMMLLILWFYQRGENASITSTCPNYTESSRKTQNLKYINFSKQFCCSFS